jgi:hypothetical protein
MRGDFSRVRFNPNKQYTRVLEQQGRVALDADANEQCAIDDFLLDTETRDIVGPFGYPAREKESFHISVQGNSLAIGLGRYYVNGLLCINPEPLTYSQQSFLIHPDPTDASLLNSLAQGAIGVIQVWLEVWQRVVTALDDPCLREPALGQADTTERLQTVWRVVASTPPQSSARRLTRAAFSRAALLPRPTQGLAAAAPSPVLEDCCAAMRVPPPTPVSPGKMTASTGTGSGECSCEPTPPAGYVGLENQLYRIEIHQGGDETRATFKWSRENASVVVGITGVHGSQVYVDSVGPDANLGFSSGQWVEVSDDSFLFGPDPPNQPGDLYQIQLVTPESLTVTMKNTVAAVDPTLHACMRRWDQFGSYAGSAGIALPVASAYVLENGISVQFTAGQYEPGDYWLIPARTATGEIEWPPCDSDGSAFQPPRRTQVFRAPLACIQWDSAKRQPAVHDCRSPFSALTDLNPSAAAAAMHVNGISWTNDDFMTFDQLLSRPLPGTVGLTAGSSSVTGNGTHFTTELAPGEWLLFNSDQNFFQVATISSDIKLTLASNYTGNTSQSTTALISGLAVALDNPAPPASILSASNFIVTLEVAIPIPVRANPGFLRVLDTVPEPFRASILPLFRSAEAAAAARAVPRPGLAVGALALPTAGAVLLNAPSIVRFDLQLDGFVNSAGSALTWLPALSFRADFTTIAFINALLSIGAAEGVFSRVRVRLDGRTIFITDNSGALVYLDGQSYGASGSSRLDGSPRIDLQLPSGNSEKASDFESWFFLSPILTIVSLTVQPEAVTVSQGAPPPTATGTVTLNYPPPADTTISLSVAPPAGALPSVTVPGSVTVPKGSVSQTFTVSVFNTGTPKAQPFVITASMPSALGMSRSQTATLNVTGFSVVH